MREICPVRTRDDREGAMKKMAELRKETLEKAAAKLNDEQQKTWKELIGAPFEVKYPAPAATVIERLVPSPSDVEDGPSTSLKPATRSRIDDPGSRSLRSDGRSPLSSVAQSVGLIPPSRSWPDCAACRYRSPAGARHDRPATGAGRRPGAAARPRARREPAGRHRTTRPERDRLRFRP